MAGSSNFLIFDENQTNIMSDTNYNANGTRLNGVVAGQASAVLHNKLYYQTSVFCAAFAQAMANKGYAVSDSSFSTLATLLANVLTKADYPYVAETGSGDNYFWRKWSDGIIEQWCEGVNTTVGDQLQTITLPKTFTTEIYQTIVSTKGNSVVYSDMWFQEIESYIDRIEVVSQWSGGGSISSGAKPKIYVIGK